MIPRITITTSSEGELTICLNEEGRDLLVKELTALRTGSGGDHFHVGSWEGAEVQISAVGHRPADKVIHAAKVILRSDEPYS